MFNIVCDKNNDLLKILLNNGFEIRRYDSVDLALRGSDDKSNLLVLADEYPQKTVNLSSADFQKIADKNLRVYIEYPSSIPGQPSGEIQKIKLERGVVASDVFGGSLQPMRILAIHGCHYVRYAATSPHIVIAKVAGFDTAVYGLPRESHPVLFEESGMLISSTKLSQFVTARYAPADAWRHIWQWILQWADGGADVLKLTWTDSVRPTYGKAEKLGDDFEEQAFRRGAAWYKNAKLFIHPEWKMNFSGTEGVTAGEIPAGLDVSLPGPGKEWKCGDGTLGMIEGADATVHYDGSQDWRYCVRNDCVCESSMAMAMSGYLDDVPMDRQIAANLNDFIYVNSNFTKARRADPDSASYGLVTWTTNDSDGGAYYGDDNARALLGSLTAAALLNENRWNEKLLRCIMANLRTTGRKGFRGPRWNDGELQKVGWRKLWEGDIENYAPHYESWLWACFLWAYDKTGFAPLLERASAGIGNMMAGYPDKWVWANGIQQERARMLLPLAWLVRVADTPEHRGWLKFMANELLSHQTECGAICEEIGSVGRGKYGPPKSNEEYGTRESPLIQQNGDPLCDLLYTANFAFVGLHEAAYATGDSFYQEAADKLAEFFCRVQIRSEKHPEFDGAWFRAFEFKRWEYWASNADLGWAAWCIESGWTQAWLVTVLGLRRKKKSLWDVLAAVSMFDKSEKIISEMFQDKLDA